MTTIGGEDLNFTGKGMSDICARLKESEPKTVKQSSGPKSVGGKRITPAKKAKPEKLKLYTPVSGKSIKGIEAKGTEDYEGARIKGVKDSDIGILKCAGGGKGDINDGSIPSKAKPKKKRQSSKDRRRSRERDPDVIVVDDLSAYLAARASTPRIGEVF